MRNHVLSMTVFWGVVTLVLGGCNRGPVSPQKPWIPISGDLVWVEGAAVGTVYEAILVTVKEMNLSVIKQDYDDLSGVVITKNLEEQRITIKIEAETHETTRVSIRVGMWADEKKDRVIYSKIKKNL